MYLPICLMDFLVNLAFTVLNFLYSEYNNSSHRLFSLYITTSSFPLIVHCAEALEYSKTLVIISFYYFLNYWNCIRKPLPMPTCKMFCPTSFKVLTLWFILSWYFHRVMIWFKSSTRENIVLLKSFVKEIVFLNMYLAPLSIIGWLWVHGYISESHIVFY